jgi:2-methylcitrate dehydratase PrpD
VIHPYISAVLRLRAKHGIQPGDVERIECPVTAFIVGIVCEPTEEKFAPASDSHGRVSLQYSLAEALYPRSAGQIRVQRGKSQESGDPRARAPRAVSRRSGLSRPRPLQGRRQGSCSKMGRTFEEVEEYNRGSAENPMTI